LGLLIRTTLLEDSLGNDLGVVIVGTDVAQQ
jgi:hypothetical protein